VVTTEQVLERIDAAVEGVCACGCRRPITDGSPSAWFASEECADRWHGRLAGGWLQREAGLLRSWGRAELEEFVNELCELLRQVGEPLQRLVADLAAAFGVVPGPTDPRERALWLRKHRHTGPKVKMRAPRRMDPGRGIDTAGRPPRLYRRLT
jgi:hypothetical protein